LWLRFEQEVVGKRARVNGACGCRGAGRTAQMRGVSAKITAIPVESCGISEYIVKYHIVMGTANPRKRVKIMAGDFIPHQDRTFWE
jgi:hypothetical protein